ncbi:TPA_asm: hypothetical protein vir520_00015 [Caudoviricetes sp. vir520]|nr:TPA_asm: hypothetical protein vir520_00015 [Caudoviricetes sp. vir520]
MIQINLHGQSIPNFHREPKRDDIYIEDCEYCNGMGTIDIWDKEWNLIIPIECRKCKGRGYHEVIYGDRY